MSPAPSIALRAEGLRAARARGTLNLDCVYGSVTVVTGPSAKETTRWLETLAGQRAPDAGHLNVPDHGGGNGPQRKAGYVDANAPLLSTLNVRMNVMLPRLWHFRESRARARQCADDLLDRVGYAGSRDEPPARLDKLECMQALLARALAPDPPLMFIDEPFAIETVNAWPQLAKCLRALASDDDRAVLVATRNLAFAAAYADQIVFVESGHAVAYGSWQEFAAADAPAGFIGGLPFALRVASA